MKFFISMLLKEARFYKHSFVGGILAVAICTFTLLYTLFIFNVFDKKTEQILVEKEQFAKKNFANYKEEMRKATLKLGFNLVILPKSQDISQWYNYDFADSFMPEEYVMMLADSGIVLVRHFLPILQEKITWKEQKRKIILVGTRGEVPNLHKNKRTPMVDPVQMHTIVLGYELHRSLKLKIGDSIRLLGRDFKVAKCYKQRGNKDDISVWIHLKEAQELLNKDGKINAILALECLCAGNDGMLAKIRGKIAKILPDTRVIERGSKALSRAETRLGAKKKIKEYLDAEWEKREQLRNKRKKLAGVIVVPILLFCIVWLTFLVLNNVKDRLYEIAILQTLGYRLLYIVTLLLSKVFIMTCFGIGFGVSLATVICKFYAQNIAVKIGIMDLNRNLIASSIFLLLVLSLMVSWLPILYGVCKEPTGILGKN